MNIGPEMLFLVLLAFLLFGPKKLPEIGRKIGRSLAEFKRASNELKGQLENEMRLLEAEDRKNLATISTASGKHHCHLAPDGVYLIGSRRYRSRRGSRRAGCESPSFARSWSRKCLRPIPSSRPGTSSPA